jgi:putative ABC transport system substrate-binding protein
VRLSRRQFVAGAASLALLNAGACLPVPLQPQRQPSRAARVGFLGPAVVLPGFRSAMAESGYVEGQNLTIEHRDVPFDLETAREARGFAAGAEDLVGLRVDVIVAANTTAASAAQTATETIPIVTTGPGADLAASGLVDSLARPGRNLTGVSVPSSLSGKRLQLLVESVPGTTRVAVLHRDNQPQRDLVRELEVPAHQLGVRLLPLAVGSADELEGAFGAAVRAQAEALYVITNAVALERRSRVLDLAILHRLPAMYDTAGFVPAGGLMHYLPNSTEVFRRVAYYVDRILKGAKPADLPVEQPMYFDFVVNMKTARELGITFPNEIMLQVTEVIE